mgnify:CR=1 FL=1
MKVPVLLPKIFNYPFTYSFNSSKTIKAGEFVQVPFGNSKVIGVVWDEIQNANKKIKLRKIENIIENISINRDLIKFINWFSMYNLTPKGMVLKMCLGDEKNILKKDILIKNLNLKKNIYQLNLDQKKSLKKLKTLAGGQRHDR